MPFIRRMLQDESMVWLIKKDLSKEDTWFYDNHSKGYRQAL